MIRRYNKLSFAYGVPGFLLQLAGRAWSNIAAENMDATGILLGTLFSLVGAVLFVIGLAYYAKSKGRHPAWGFMGLLSLIGLIILFFLKDHSNKPLGGVKEEN